MPRERLTKELTSVMKVSAPGPTIRFTLDWKELYGVSADHMHADAWISNNRRGSTASVLFTLSYGTEATGLGMAGPPAGSDLEVVRVDLKHNAAVARAEQAESSDRMATWCPIDGEGTLYWYPISHLWMLEGRGVEESVEEEKKRGCRDLPERIVYISDHCVTRSSYRKFGIYELGYSDISAFSLSALTSALVFSHKASFWAECLQSSLISFKSRVRSMQWL
jgi:hypothetical protein